jgi:hypothetical protein
MFPTPFKATQNLTFNGHITSLSEACNVSNLFVALQTSAIKFFKADYQKMTLIDVRKISHEGLMY